jgi:hypothetical protein
LTTYFSQRPARESHGVGESNDAEPGGSVAVNRSLQFESRREKVKAISNRDPSEDNACGCLFHGRTIALERVHV